MLSRSNYSPHVSYGGSAQTGKKKKTQAGGGGGGPRPSGAAFSPAYNLQKSRTLARSATKRQSMVSILSGPTGMYTEHIAWARSPTFKPKVSAVGGATAVAAAAAVIGRGAAGGTPDPVTYPTASWTEKRPPTSAEAS